MSQPEITPNNPLFRYLPQEEIKSLEGSPIYGYLQILYYTYYRQRIPKELIQAVVSAVPRNQEDLKNVFQSWNMQVVAEQKKQDSASFMNDPFFAMMQEHIIAWMARAYGEDRIDEQCIEKKMGALKAEFRKYILPSRGAEQLRNTDQGDATIESRPISPEQLAYQDQLKKLEVKKTITLEDIRYLFQLDLQNQLRRLGNRGNSFSSDPSVRADATALTMIDQSWESNRHMACVYTFNQLGVQLAGGEWEGA